MLHLLHSQLMDHFLASIDPSERHEVELVIVRDIHAAKRYVKKLYDGDPDRLTTVSFYGPSNEFQTIIESLTKTSMCTLIHSPLLY